MLSMDTPGASLSPLPMDLSLRFLPQTLGVFLETKGNFGASTFRNTPRMSQTDHIDSLICAYVKKMMFYYRNAILTVHMSSRHILVPHHSMVFSKCGIWFFCPRNNEATIHHELHVGCATCLRTCGVFGVEKSNQSTLQGGPHHQL